MPEGALDRKPHGIFRMLGGFIDAILHGAPNADQDGDFLDGYRSQSAIDATIKAGLSRQWVAVDTDLPGA
jgi:predicted dehydrogenase